MVVFLPQSGKNPLSGLLTNVNRQASDIGFNISFKNLENTVIRRFNAEAEKLTNATNNQRELNNLNKTFNDLAVRRNEVLKFAFANEANVDHHIELTTAITTAIAAISSDDDTDNVSASEVSAYEAALAEIVTVSDRLVELNHPDYVDGNNVTNLRSMIDSLQALTPVAGVVDPDDTSPTTNDNSTIEDMLSTLSTTNINAQATATTLEEFSKDVVIQMDRKLADTKSEIVDINVIRAGEIEFEIQLLKVKYANFLRSIELAFDGQAQSNARLADALNPDIEPPLDSIVSILV